MNSIGGIKKLIGGLTRIMIIALICTFALPFMYVSLSFKSFSGGIGDALGSVVGDLGSNILSGLGGTVGSLVDQKIKVGAGVSLINIISAYNLKFEVSGEALIQGKTVLLLMLIPIAGLLFLWMNDKTIKVKARSITTIILSVVYFIIYCIITNKIISGVNQGKIAGIETIFDLIGIDNAKEGAIQASVASGTIITYVCLVLIVLFAVFDMLTEGYDDVTLNEATKMMATHVLVTPNVCAKCGNPIPAGALFCLNCGERVDTADENKIDGGNELVFCPSCGKAIQEGMEFCPNCGGKVTE